MHGAAGGGGRGNLVHGQQTVRLAVIVSIHLLALLVVRTVGLLMEHVHVQGTLGTSYTGPCWALVRHCHTANVVASMVRR